MRLLVLACAALLAITPTLAQDFPQTGIPDVQNGISAPFAGNWSLRIAAAEQDADIVTCAEPDTIIALDDAHIEYGSRRFEVYEFSDRTTWYPEDDGPSSIAVWSAIDEFYLYPVGMEGSADWDNPVLFVRCP